MDGSPDHFLPVNGLKNFNFYYLPDGTGFIPAGGYRVWYFGANKTTSYGFDDVNYAPNTGYTNGKEVRPFYIPTSNPPILPLGVHGVVLGYVPNGGGTTAPLKNATVRAMTGGQPQQFSLTNANGYFSFYYANGFASSFFPAVPHWQLLISGSMNGCSYQRTIPNSGVLWAPNNINDPNQLTYWVTNATWEVDIPPLTPNCSDEEM